MTRRSAIHGRQRAGRRDIERRPRRLSFAHCRAAERPLRRQFPFRMPTTYGDPIDAEPEYCQRTSAPRADRRRISFAGRTPARALDSGRGARARARNLALLKHAPALERGVHPTRAPRLKPCVQPDGSFGVSTLCRRAPDTWRTRRPAASVEISSCSALLSAPVRPLTSR